MKIYKILFIACLAVTLNLSGQTYSEDFIEGYPYFERLKDKDKVFSIVEMTCPTGEEFGELVTYNPTELSEYYYIKGKPCRIVKNIIEDRELRKYIYEYEYDSLGYLVSKTITEPNKNYEYKKYTYEYFPNNHNGKPIKSSIYLQKGNIQGVNRDKQLYKVYKYNYSKPDSISIAIYNNDGRLIANCLETSSYRLISKTDKKYPELSQEFNEYGDLVKATSAIRNYAYQGYAQYEYVNGEISRKKLFFNDNSFRSTIVNKYESFDVANNWTKKYEISSSDSENFIVEAISGGNNTTYIERYINYLSNEWNEGYVNFVYGLISASAREENLQKLAKLCEVAPVQTGFLISTTKLQIEYEFGFKSGVGVVAERKLPRFGEVKKITQDGEIFTFELKDKFVVASEELSEIKELEVKVYDQLNQKRSFKCYSDINYMCSFIPELELLIIQEDAGMKCYSVTSKAIKNLEFPQK